MSRSPRQSAMGDQGGATGIGGAGVAALHSISARKAIQPPMQNARNRSAGAPPDAGPL